jgi:hypothetical protein
MFCIRKAEASDAEATAQIHASSWAASYSSF